MFRRALRLTGRLIAALGCFLSLTVCAAAAFLWVRGYRVVDIVERPTYRPTPTHDDSTTYRISSGRGVVALTVHRERTMWEGRRSAKRLRVVPPRRSYRYAALRPDQFHLQQRTVWQRLGFNAYFRRGPVNMVGATHGNFGRMTAQDTDWGFRVPYWLVVPAAGVPPLLYLRRRVNLRRRYRTRRGLCGGCGYDLRASPERCPECGLTTEFTGVKSRPTAAPHPE